MPALKKIAAVKPKAKTASKAKTAAKRQAQPKRAAPAPHQAAPAPPPTPKPAPPAPVSAPKPVTGKARAQIVAACSRPDGATAKELFAITGWTYASWSHQLKLAAKATGWTPHIEAIEGTKRYFLREPAGH